MAAWQADHDGIENFSLLVSHVLVPPAMEALLSSDNCVVQGFLAAGPRLHHHGLRRICSHRRALRSSDRGDRLRAARHSRRHSHDGQPTGRRPSRSREPVRARRVGGKGTARRKERIIEVFEVANRQWRGLGEIPDERISSCADAFRATMPTGASRSRACRRRNRRNASAD